jgi:MobA/MobL family
MANYHLHIQSIGRGEGRSAVAAAAYRRCTRMDDERTGHAHDFRAKGGHVAGGMTGWDDDPAALWNAAEAAERHPRAMLAREVQIALPRELDESSRRRLVQDFAAWLRARHGVAVQWDLHRPDRTAETDNPHAHLMMTTRMVGPDGRFGAKTRDLDKSSTSSGHITAWRAEWARAVNAELAAAGSVARVDGRSLRARAEAAGQPAPEPMERLGPAAAAMERRGRRTAKGERNRRRKARNAERRALAAERESPDDDRRIRRRLRAEAVAAVADFHDQSMIHPRPVLDRAAAFRAMIDTARAAWPQGWPRALRWILRRSWPTGWRVVATVGDGLRLAGRLSRAEAEAAAVLAAVLRDGPHQRPGRVRSR